MTWLAYIQTPAGVEQVGEHEDLPRAMWVAASHARQRASTEPLTGVAYGVTRDIETIRRAVEPRGNWASWRRSGSR